jgi:hypothetical protein
MLTKVYFYFFLAFTLSTTAIFFADFTPVKVLFGILSGVMLLMGIIMYNAREDQEDTAHNRVEWDDDNFHPDQPH